MKPLADSLESLAGLLEAKAKKKKRRLLFVFAFGEFDRLGKPVDPEDIEPGDLLYRRRTEDTAAGAISKSPRGLPYATALEFLAGGKSGKIRTALYEKRWETDDDPCDTCLMNATAGWIDADETFPSGHEEPDAHPNCKCELLVRPAEE